MKNNLAALDVFAEVVNVMIQTGLWNADLARYLRVHLSGIAPMAWKTTSESTLLVPPDLNWSLKLLQPSGFSTVINCSFNFHTVNVLRRFRGIIANSRAWSISSRNRLCFTFIFTSYKSNKFYIALIPMGKVWIQLFSLQLWVNSRADWVLQPWCGN